MESLPEGWQTDPETGIKSYNPIEAAKALIEGRGKEAKIRIQKRETVVDDLEGLSARLDALEERQGAVEAKFKALYVVVEGLQERIGD